MPSSPLEHARAIVTGASSGIGEGIARAFAKAGASVIVNYHSDAEAAARIVGDIRDGGGQAEAVQADISTPEGCETLFDAAEERFGGLDVLVSNAGIQRDAAFTELTLEDWRQVLDVNLTGQFLCAQEAVRRFRAQGHAPDRSPALGKIIFTSSVHQAIPWAGHTNYATAKGGVKLLMESMAQELACEKIRVNAIAPGAIKTSINRDAWEDEAAKEQLLKLIPYGRVGEPEDVAQAAVWLASDASDYVVGTTLFVDGGMTLYPSFREGG
ncbi:SDR family oxidoreductase [Thalassorhabdomicrobium marinisediminis]|uniref:Sugar dehydrogenase n=1 Tax=Thalassorhabdomicrobium marinisediminis TaxID=2170577 RepID=A0A2T7G1S4_9RHOB|nr:SDR family oxidoreductase [Thalassorhabdomicrobium marinisediminis]PVA08373.1 sugar dehydrogenase [Thalassorhabdomicrobium marinisediminis]